MSFWAKSIRSNWINVIKLLISILNQNSCNSKQFIIPLHCWSERVHPSIYLLISRSCSMSNKLERLFLPGIEAPHTTAQCEHANANRREMRSVWGQHAARWLACCPPHQHNAAVLHCPNQFVACAVIMCPPLRLEKVALEKIHSLGKERYSATDTEIMTQSREFSQIWKST